MPQLFSNNAITLLLTSITDSSTSITVYPGSGGLFNTNLSSSDYEILTLEAADGSREIVKAISASGDTITIVRAQEGTSAKPFLNDSLIFSGITKGGLEYLPKSGGLSTSIRGHSTSSNSTFISPDVQSVPLLGSTYITTSSIIISNTTTAIGYDISEAYSGSSGNTYLGKNISSYSSSGCIALGSSSSCASFNSIAIGQDSVSTSSNNIALGPSTTSSGSGSVSIGSGAKSLSGESIAIGRGSESAGYNSIAVWSSYGGVVTLPPRFGALAAGPSDIVFNGITSPLGSNNIVLARATSSGNVTNNLIYGNNNIFIGDNKTSMVLPKDNLVHITRLHTAGSSLEFVLGNSIFISPSGYTPGTLSASLSGLFINVPLTAGAKTDCIAISAHTVSANNLGAESTLIGISSSTLGSGLRCTGIGTSITHGSSNRSVGIGSGSRPALNNSVSIIGMPTLVSSVNPVTTSVFAKAASYEGLCASINLASTLLNVANATNHMPANSSGLDYFFICTGITFIVISGSFTTPPTLKLSANGGANGYTFTPISGSLYSVYTIGRDSSLVLLSPAIGEQLSLQVVTGSTGTYTAKVIVHGYTTL